MVPALKNGWSWGILQGTVKEFDSDQFLHPSEAGSLFLWMPVPGAAATF